MKVVHKYTVYSRSMESLLMPKGAVPRAVQMQDGMAVLWAEHDTDEHVPVERTVHVIGTGQFFDEEGLDFVDTLFEEDWVWHIYITRES
jgi:hypothetical protein